MAALLRALIYASAFVGFLLVFVPARVLELSGVSRPAVLGVRQFAGAAVTLSGSALVLWCILTFALVGRGTQAPFDPPQRLVMRGAYRYVRNPMYLGAGLALGGAALFYGSMALLAYLGLLGVASHLFVRLYEEPTLRRTFGAQYALYCEAVRRWLPRWPRAASSSGAEASR
jgi:protein-S-isoprenylcysteine O-methyltransferase Ste14